MSEARVKFAQPTDSSYKGGRRITALEARELFFSSPQQITDKHNFVCGNDGCKASITCRAIDSNSVAPAFVDAITKINVHTCFLKDVDSRENTVNVNDDFPHSRYEQSGITIIDPFIEEDQPIIDASSFQLNIFSDREKGSHGHKGQTQNVKQKRDSHPKSLPDIVDMFLTNKNKVVYHKFGKTMIQFKIGDFFFRIEDSFVSKLLFKNAPIFFYGEGKIKEYKKDIYRIEFIEKADNKYVNMFIYKSNLQRVMPTYIECLKRHKTIQIFTRIKPKINPKNNKFANIELHGKNPIENYLMIIQ